MAAVGCTDEKESSVDSNTKKMLSASRTIPSVVFDRNPNFGELETLQADDEIAKCIARWNSAHFPNNLNKAASNIVNLLQKATGANPLNLPEHCERRTLRIERAGSTESVVVTSGGESCQSSSIASDSASEPSSPSRPVTPQPMPPVPTHLGIDHCHYECLRADSEDSGFGPSPAKSSMGPSSPLDAGAFSVSPIQFADDEEAGEAEDEDEDDDEESSSDNHETVTSLLDLSTSRKNCFTSNVNDCEDASSPKGFLPYTVAKLAASDEFQKQDLVKTDCDQNKNDSFRFSLLCSDERTADVTLGRSTVPSEKCDNNLDQNVLDFQFLMNSVSRDGRPLSNSENVNTSVADQKRDVVPVSHTTPNELLSQLPLTSSPEDHSGNEVNINDTSVVPSLATDVSSCVRESDALLSNCAPKTEKDNCLTFLSPTNLETQLDEVSFVRIKTEIIEDEEDKCDVSDRLENAETFLDPKEVLVRQRNQNRGRKRSVEMDPCDENSQDLPRSELCPELSGDCTSSSCSQATIATDSQSTISSSSADDTTSCKWLNCDQKADANANLSDLLDHLRKCHVQTQFDDNSSYVCLWIGCKVYDRPSSSRSWLERHVLLHGGSKPFRCIVDGCRHRFGTEGALQRHVNSHFPQNSSSSTARNAHGGKNGHGEHGYHYHHHHCGILGSGPNGRLLKRKRLKFRRRPHSVKTNDFFDDGIMEQVRHSLFELSSIEGMDRAGPPAAITFHSTVSLSVL